MVGTSAAGFLALAVLGSLFMLLLLDQRSIAYQPARYPANLPTRQRANRL